MIITLIVGAVGFVAGILVGRNNVKKVEAVVAEAKTVEKTVAAKL